MLEIFVKEDFLSGNFQVFEFGEEVEEFSFAWLVFVPPESLWLSRDATLCIFLLLFPSFFKFMSLYSY